MRGQRPHDPVDAALRSIRLPGALGRCRSACCVLFHAGPPRARVYTKRDANRGAACESREYAEDFRMTCQSPIGRRVARCPSPIAPAVG